MTVDVSDIETALGRTLSAGETAQAQQWTADALMLVGLRLGDLTALNQPALDYVVREATVARFRNPDAREYEAIDDYRYGMPKETRSVTILPEWWEMLTPFRESAVFSARPQFAVDTPTADLDWT